MIEMQNEISNKESDENTANKDTEMEKRCFQIGQSEWWVIYEPSTQKTYFYSGVEKDTRWLLPSGFYKRYSKEISEIAQREKIRIPSSKEEIPFLSEDNVIAGSNTDSNSEKRGSRIHQTDWWVIEDPKVPRNYFYNSKTVKCSWELPKHIRKSQKLSSYLNKDLVKKSSRLEEPIKARGKSSYIQKDPDFNVEAIPPALNFEDAGSNYQIDFTASNNANPRTPSEKKDNIETFWCTIDSGSSRSAHSKQTAIIKEETSNFDPRQAFSISDSKAQQSKPVANQGGIPPSTPKIASNCSKAPPRMGPAILETLPQNCAREIRASEMSQIRQSGPSERFNTGNRPKNFSLNEQSKPPQNPSNTVPLVRQKVPCNLAPFSVNLRQGVGGMNIPKFPPVAEAGYQNPVSTRTRAGVSRSDAILEQHLRDKMLKRDRVSSFGPAQSIEEVNYKRNFIERINTLQNAKAKKFLMRKKALLSICRDNYPPVFEDLDEPAIINKVYDTELAETVSQKRYWQKKYLNQRDKLLRMKMEEKKRNLSPAERKIVETPENRNRDQMMASVLNNLRYASASALRDVLSINDMKQAVILKSMLVDETSLSTIDHFLKKKQIQNPNTVENHPTYEEKRLITDEEAVKRHVCFMCRFKFESEERMRQHIEEFSMNFFQMVNSLCCFFCDIRFSSRLMMQAHMIQVHPKEAIKLDHEIWQRMNSKKTHAGRKRKPNECDITKKEAGRNNHDIEDNTPT